jgi:hypothetical protein
VIRFPVESSSLDSVGHDAASNTLEVEFKNGSVYQYDNVDAEEHKSLLAAESIGSHFHTNIRSKKLGRRLE